MPRIVAEKRDRRIMFRISHEEHERLRRICVATRTSSVSELVRRAVSSRWLEGDPAHADDVLTSRVDQLERRVEELASICEELHRV